MFTPVKTSASGVAIFTALVATQSLLSLSVHFGSDNLFSMMVPRVIFHPHSDLVSASQQTKQN